MAYQLVVENYGKIERAELNIAPMTLFVGDNNSGKSYLLSLIWALSSGRQDQILYKGLKSLLVEKYTDLYNRFEWLLSKEAIDKEDRSIIIEEKELADIMNTVFTMNKDAFVKSLFNYEGMSIGKLAIQINESQPYKVIRMPSDDGVGIRIQINEEEKMRFVFVKRADVNAAAIARIVHELLNLILRNELPRSATYYLPAARTGFMLAKNSINQVGRKKAFDIIVEEDGESSDIEVSPFPKSIIHFLDTMDSLNTDTLNKEYVSMAVWAEHYMADGNIEYTDSNNGSIQYIPEGMEIGLPLRVSSGVVTELSPLILLLKYSRRLKMICYEEPEMCLHPQLQYQMARLLVRMVNSGIRIAASTHSDIIIQHINNMCQLYGSNNKEAVLENSDFETDDLINVEKIAIYQLSVQGNTTKVERILPENNVFSIPTFRDALKSILEQTLEISDAFYGEEE